VARGIARGVARHYREKLEIVDRECMLRGADRCLILFRTPSTRAIPSMPA
jgi:hypothetical protein